MWKKIFLIIVLSVILVFSGGSLVFAQCGVPAFDCEEYCENSCHEEPPGSGSYVGLDPPSSGLCYCNPLKADSLEDLIVAVIDFVFWVATIIFPIIIIYGGFLFMTSQGDDYKLKDAKNLIIYAIAGYFIILFAQGLVYILKEIIGG